MPRLSMKVPRWLVAGALLGVGACAPISPVAGDPAGGGAATPEAERVIGFGLAMIQDRYLSPVAIGDVAVAGMGGLSKIDPALSIERPTGQRLFLRYQGEALADYPAPADDDVAGWSAMIVRAEREASAVSPKLRAAGSEQLYQAVFDAGLAKLDRFSRYAGAVAARRRRAARDGFGGIGVHYDLHAGDVVLTEVAPDSPASRARLRIGDHVSAIDGTALAGLDSTSVADLFDGPVASSVALTVRHPGNRQAAQINLDRILVVPRSVTMTMADGIATIGISSFRRNTAETVAKDLVKAEAIPGFRGVILDLRGTPGGLLDEGIAVAGLFIDHGRIGLTRGRNPSSVQLYDATPGAPGRTVPLVVLVDGGSASAAEIVAAALQDSGRAVLVGTNTYGKGTVQAVIRMPNGGEMTLSWARFYAPSGYALHGLGVLPTVCTADPNTTPATALATIGDGHSPVRGTIAAWRATTIEETALRARLRTVCPAGRHPDAPRDRAVARDLLNNPGLYQQALDLTAPAVAAATTAMAVHQP